MKHALAAALAALLLSGPAARAQAPVFDPGGYDDEAMGAGLGYPVAARGQRMDRDKLVGSLTAYDAIWTARTIARPDAASPLKRAPEPAIRYRWRNADAGLDEYLARNPTTALLIAKGDTIYVERYRYARRDDMRFTSFSMAKTVTGLLAGIALAEGHIKSIDDTADKYVPELAGAEYGRTPLKALLSMSSGVAFREDYGGSDDIATLVRQGYAGLGPGGPGVLRRFDTRTAPPDTRFSYASSETHVLGAVVAAATGRTLADYAGEKIWRPLGAEADASWVVDKAGLEAAYCCFNAVLRDWARLGLMLAHDGAWNGAQIVPRDWLYAATSADPARPHLLPRRATDFFGYGYQTWLFPEGERNFALLGVYGQAIFVDPASKLVMVHLAARRVSKDPDAPQTVALWRGVRAALAR